LIDRDIRLYQRLTKIMARLTTEVENHMEERLRSFDQAFDRTSDALNSLEPRVDAAKSSLGELEEMISSRLFHLAQVSRFIETKDRISDTWIGPERQAEPRT
jgi:uncharacterized protein YaaN involved in tellurite resistance